MARTFAYLIDNVVNFSHNTTVLDKDKLQTEKINAALSNYFLVAIANIITSLLLYFSLTTSQGINILHLNAWIASQVLLGVIWATIHFRYAENFESIQAIWDWYIDMPLNIWAGLGWGLCWAIFIDPNDLHTAFFLNTAICGVVLGIVVTNPLDQRAMTATLLPCLLPVIIKAFWLGGDLFNWIAIIATLFLGAAYGFSRVLQNIYLTMLKERELSKQLVIKLEEEKAKIEKINQEKNRFLAAASHDLRQPAQAIRLYEGLLSASIKNDQQKTLLQKISEANDSLSGLLESLLDISKLDSGTITANPKIILLNELFDRIYEQYGDQAFAKAIQLVVMPNSHARICIDPLHLQRIVNNLIENAIRHMGRPGKILLGARCFENEVQIEVHDNGIGIPEEQLEEVFNEFYRVNNEHRNKSKGLGLGLSIVKRLADMNACTIDLISKPGRGCCFRLHIPQKQFATHSAQTVIHGHQEAGTVQIGNDMTIPQYLRNKLVLVLDDEPEVADALGALLKSWGLKVNPTNSIDLALESSLHNIPNLILSDFRLPNEQTGIEAINQLRQQAGENLPAIILTGNTQPDVMKLLFQQGFPVLFKPVQARQLKAAIMQQLDNTPSADTG